MSSSNSQYYHFAWNESERTPSVAPPDVTARERVARILRETELGEVPDLVFRSAGDARAPAGRDVSGVRALREENQLFSIDDADWSNDEEVNNDDVREAAGNARDVRGVSVSAGADEQLLRVSTSSLERRNSRSKTNSKGQCCLLRCNQDVTI